MITNTLKVLAGIIAAALLFPLSEGMTYAESLNPEGINPHAEAPKKRITLEQKMAAAEARKKKMAEIEARKAGQPGQLLMMQPGALSPGFPNETRESNK